MTLAPSLLPPSLLALVRSLFLLSLLLSLLSPFPWEIFLPIFLPSFLPSHLPFSVASKFFLFAHPFLLQTLDTSLRTRVRKKMYYCRTTEVSFYFLVPLELSLLIPIVSKG